jgi:hypothetical protein
MDAVLVNTGGNALQAAPRSILKKGADDTLLAVVAPSNVVPGDTIFIFPPDGTSRLIAAIIPEGVYMGYTFFVDIPRLAAEQGASVQYSSPLVVTGIVIEGPQVKP